jgi:hypothetical protein
VGGKGGGEVDGDGNISRIGWVGVSGGTNAGDGGVSRGGSTDGGAGGGGYGGGETGNAGIGIPPGGGGGGGSWARQATVDDTGFPFLGEANPPTTDNGTVVFSFALCAVYPEEFSCD